MNAIRDGFALAAAVSALTATARASSEIEPGMALPPEAPASEAQHYERLLTGDSTPMRLGARDDTVDERRHFDDQVFHAGIGTGFGTPLGMIGAFVEASPADFIALGVGSGIHLWGPAAGAFVRLRPIVWGGQGLGVLHAFTLQASATYMRDGELDLMPCVHTCAEVGFSSRRALFTALSAGFEHRLVSGWTYRYDFGAAHAAWASPWRCTRYDTGAPVPCGGGAPSDTAFVATFAISHTL
jgi:hypothetical protein